METLTIGRVASRRIGVETIRESGGFFILPKSSFLSSSKARRWSLKRNYALPLQYYAAVSLPQSLRIFSKSFCHASASP